jgi:pyrophosphatase PpaX
MTAAFPGVTEVITDLATRGHPMAVVTSKLCAGATLALNHTGMRAHFGSIVGADSVINAKPHAEPVHKALAELGGSADNAFFVGDSPHDIAAGNAAGVATVAVTWGPFSRDQIEAAKPRHWIASIAELPALVR